MASCNDFLLIEPESKIYAEAVFESPQKTNAYIVGLYKEFRDSHKTWAEYSLGTDEYKLGGVQYRDNADKRGIELYNEEMTSTNQYTLDFWTKRYQIVSKATLAIDKLVDVSESDSAMARYYSEACALRGACYFELIQSFGEIPLNNTEIVAEHGSKRQPQELVYNTIIQDFQNALKYLPEHSSEAYEADKSRFSKAFAHAMLGKTYLYALEESGMRDYELAAEHFQVVYEDPAFRQTGASDYAVIFDENGLSHTDNEMEYEREMVYAFRFTNTKPDNSEQQWNVGSRAVSIMSDVEATIYFAGFDHIMPTRYCYSMTDEGGLWEEGDKRKDVSIRYDFTYEGMTPVLLGWCYGDELDPHIKKYEDKRIEEKGLNTFYSGKPMPYLRFGDIVLCYGEALYFSGEQARGIQLINEKIRARAFGGRPVGPNMWPTDLPADEFMDRLMDERMRELCFEGWRRMDLIRTGMVEKLVPARNTWFLNEGITTVDKNRFRYPIPLDEISMNQDMGPESQNPGY